MLITFKHKHYNSNFVFSSDKESKSGEKKYFWLKGEEGGLIRVPAGQESRYSLNLNILSHIFFLISFFIIIIFYFFSYF